MNPQIVVNTRLLVPGKLEGMGRFAHETLQRLTADMKDAHFHFVFDREFDEQFVYGPNITPHVIYPSARHPFLFYTWFELRMPGLLRKLKADLFLSPDGYLSLNSSVKQLPVIHDINFEHYPQHLPFAARLYLKQFFPKFAKKAERIATVSEFSKADLVTQYGAVSEKIDVIYNGASAIFKPLKPEEKKAAAIRFAQGCPYFIYVGALQPRKNIVTLLKAFDQFKTKHGTNRKLLITGQKKWWSSEQEEVFANMQFKEDVLFMGRVDDEALAMALGGADALTYISFFEGFGIPLLEAMNCDVPVLTSRLTSMPEVAGDAAAYCSPFDVGSVVLAMEEVLVNADKLVETGRKQRQLFSWNKTADLLKKSVEKCLEN
jgi:glycosyltransferase involved in cell wall biosynthesis